MTSAQAMGLRITDAGFSAAGKILLRLLSALPWAWRERLLFRPSGTCFLLQKALQRTLRGPRIVRACFTEGPLSGLLFDCSTAEKYFLLGARYEYSLQRLLREVLKPGDITYDVGAHAGYWTSLASILCGPSGAVYAFEPSPPNFHRLRRHITLNRLSNAVPFQLAVSDRETVLFLLEQGSESRIVQDSTTPAETLSSVRSIRLDDFVYRDHYLPPTFLKMDVEGYGGHCLAGMNRILQDQRPRLLCEVHNDSEAAAISSILDFHSYDHVPIERTRAYPLHWFATPREGSRARR